MAVRPIQLTAMTPLNHRVALCGFIDEPTQSTFLTKSCTVGRVYRLAGVDYESADHDRRDLVVHRFEAAVRSLDERFRIRQYLCKRRVDEFVAPACQNPVAAAAIQRRTADLNSRRSDIYRLDLYLVIEMAGPRARPRFAVSKSKTLTTLAADLVRLVHDLHHATDAVEVALADVLQPTRLAKQEAYVFLRRLLNPAPHKQTVALRSDRHVDYFAADSSVEVHPDHLLIDGRYTVKALTMKDTPTRTFAHQLQPLHAIPGEFIACLEWHRVQVSAMRTDLWWRGKHFSIGTDASVKASKEQIEQAKLAMEVQGRSFGDCSLTVLVYDLDPAVVRQATADAIKVMATHDGALIEETANLFNAWLAVLPGNDVDNIRYLRVLDINLADLSFLFTLDLGSERSAHLQAPALAVLETTTKTAFFYDMHVQDNGHMLMLGDTGSGKSVLVNCLVTHAQQYDPLTVVFDMGHSYRRLAHALGGSYLELGVKHQPVTLNPFAMPMTAENIEFLHAFVRVLLEGKDSPPLSEYENRQLYEAIESFRNYEPPQRRLLSLTLPTPLQDRLDKWLEGGRYPVFDHEEDTLSFSRFQVFEFGAMSHLAELRDPILFYVLHRVRMALGHGLTVFAMDEAWRSIQNPIIRDYLIEGLKTWRKFNAAIWLITQSLGDFDSSDGLLRTVLESCPTTLLLPNANFDRSQYREYLKLNDVELDLVTRLQPKRQLFLKRPTGSKVLTLQLDPESAWLYSNDLSPLRAVTDAA